MIARSGMGFAIGVDVGGTSTRAAVVDVDSLSLVGEILTAPTPLGATPATLGVVISELTAKAAASAQIDSSLVVKIGCALPGVVEDRRLVNAVNLGDGWNQPDALEQLGLPIGSAFVNDVDAIGFAQIAAQPQGEHEPGVSIVLSLGTGIGSALLYRNMVIPGSELGEITIDGQRFESVASGRAIQERGLDAERWAAESTPFLTLIERILSPRRWVFAGLLSGELRDFVHQLELSRPCEVAEFGDQSGVIGAALADRYV